MSKTPSPLLGFNNNVRHNGRLYHIQTEDSGVKYPHVITHLFADGGRILKTMKTSYADLLDSEDLASKVRALMKRQHKAMLLALRDGAFDEEPDTPAPAKPKASDEAAASPPGQSSPQSRGKMESGTFDRTEASSSQRQAHELDAEQLDRAAEKFFEGSNLFGDAEPGPSGQGNMRPLQAVPSSQPRMRPSLVPSSAPPQRDDNDKPGTDRPVSTSGRASPSSKSVFGESVISNQSLDEVILEFITQASGEDDEGSNKSS